MDDSEVGLSKSNFRNEKEDDSRASESEDSDASLLGIDGSRSSNFRRTYTRNIPSLRAHLWITSANIILFTISLAFMLITLQADSITLQDHWRATTFYCK